MTLHAPLIARAVPEDWDRRGLPAWTYHSPGLFEIERRAVFLNHWQIVGHVSDIPAPGDWLAFDLLGERAVVMRGRDHVVRAFHNLCRHRGARVVDGPQGHCRGSIVCPFHGWVYNTDGTLRGPARPETFGEMDRETFGLMPVEHEIWMGFIFLRFHPGPQPSVSKMLAPFAADLEGYRADTLLPVGDPGWATEVPVNWKSVRDVDNEGYHVALAHPALQDLYGRTYADHVSAEGLAWSTAEIGDAPGRMWSVRNYVKMSRPRAGMPERLGKAWTYYGIFPNQVIAFTPESAQFYHDLPVSVGVTRLSGRQYRWADEDRQTRAARYLAGRIDSQTSAEDRQLCIWSNESMRSSAFEGFHLSDLEYGVRNHHDQLRALSPLYSLETAPAEGELEARHGSKQST
jgi:phenylpropionate dioxygenase-like ring-hydroxylating dioxygenase large terminal subunit